MYRLPLAYYTQLDLPRNDYIIMTNANKYFAGT